MVLGMLAVIRSAMFTTSRATLDPDRLGPKSSLNVSFALRSLGEDRPPQNDSHNEMSLLIGETGGWAGFNFFVASGCFFQGYF